MLVASIAPGLVFAQKGDGSVDLGVRDPGILPTSKLYFLKEWSRGIQQFFTFDPAKKAELELQISNEKAAEIQKLKEREPQNKSAIERAISNYADNIDRLKARLESLRKFGRNLDVENLKNKLSEMSEKHINLFNGLKERVVNGDLLEKIKSTETVLEDVAKFPKRFGEAFSSTMIETDEHDKENYNVPQARNWKIGIVSGGEFQPKNLNIKTGDKVVWINLDSAPHSPISDDYPELEGKTIAPGEELELTFSRAGSWTYYDSLNPSATGVIIVEE